MNYATTWSANDVRTPLSDIRIACLAQQYPGPFATMILADLGADVVLVEHPDGGDPARAFPGFHGAMARGKRSVALDLKSAAGRTALEAIVRHSDVLLDGFRPGTLERLGFSARQLREYNRRLIYVTITGFGAYGKNAARPGHDLNYEAESGLLGPDLYPAGTSAEPPIELADLVSGLFAVQAVLLGLLQRGQDAPGSTFDVSMLDSLIALVSAYLVPVVNGTGSPHVPTEPGYGIFATADGRRVSLGVAYEDHFWRALCDITGLDEERDLTSSQRHADSARLHQRLAQVLAARTTDEWEQLFSGSQVPFGVVRSFAELPDLPHIKEREMFVGVQEAGGDRQTYVRQPIVVDGIPYGPRCGVPMLGEHTREVLRQCGLDEASIDGAVGR
jgi:crotonobetainyl-CoA:carnitine CoA-transferase CaiB-like acyl-CoA transferase